MQTIDENERIPMLEPYTVKQAVSALSEVEDYNHRMLNIPEMWKHTKGAGVKVAVLDTGCPKHIDLKIAGYKDFSGSKSPYDEHSGHSTHVCGIIGALENGVGVKGIAPECELYCGKVLGDDGSGSLSAIADGIRWAVDEVHADVINMSLGCSPLGAYTPSLYLACKYAKDKGVVLCCAAGNNAGAVNAPANLSTTIAISAIDRDKEQANFTCYGDEVDFAAGGVDVFSTWLNNQYALLSGTSMATPVITGVVALIIGAERKAGNKLTPDQVYQKLLEISVDIHKPGKDDYTGNGIPVFNNNKDHTTGVEPGEGAKESADSTDDDVCWLVRIWRKLFG